MTVELIPFELPLRAPITLGSETMATRRGFLLRDAARDLVAEASPLPGFSPDSRDDVFAAMVSGQDTSPALAFARDCLANPPAATAGVTVPVNALVHGTRRQMLDRASALANTACQAVKLKVARATVHEDIDTVRDVRAALRTDQALRLDANRGWTWDDAITFFRGIADVDVAYTEEPLQDATQLEALFDATGCRYALDETIVRDGDVAPFTNATALVIKPTLVGSFARLETLAALGKPLVFSAAFLSGVGVLHVARLAARFSPEIPCGLDPYSHLARDVLATPIDMSHWTVAIDHAMTLAPTEQYRA